MWILDTFGKGISPRLASILDSSFLTLTITPAIWFVLVRPLRESTRSLATTNNNLELALEQRAALEERLRRQALYDSLTALPNRAFCVKHVNRAIVRHRNRPEYRFAALFIDLDGFKVVNDTLGHEVGDALLVAAAQRLQDAVRVGDLVARWGGDEFVVVLDNADEEHDAVMIAQRIVQALEIPFVLKTREGGAEHEHEVYVSGSVGICGSGGKCASSEQVLREADVAMYRAKRAGRGRVEVFDPEMRDKIMTRIQTDFDLKRAARSLEIDKPEFFLEYQPIVSLHDDHLRGFEALLRWRHPEKGTISPLAFLPAAEESGLIVPIGEWVLKESCMELARWLGGGDDLEVTVAVNVSAKQFASPGFVRTVECALLNAALSPKHLVIEVTESIAMNNISQTQSVLNQLRPLGIRVSIDDFGTGYSSLSYLHVLPIDTLKIDRSFISRLGDNQITTGIVDTISKLGHNLGLTLVAEGIELPRQKELLKTLNCESGQGYLFSRPVSATTAREMLERSRSSAPRL
jgi:diguanylate cyclase (GGDEF)-like protein